MNNQILPIKDVVKHYDALIVDIWGVLYDGVEPYPGSVECINSMINGGKQVIFLSNNPRPYTFIKEKFIKWGVDIDKAILYTSGDAVREQLISWDDEVFKKLGKTFYHLGKERNQDILSGLDVDVTNDIKQADFLLITTYVDENEDLSAHDSFLREAAKLNIPAVCANPDLVAHHGSMIRYCAGTIGKKYEEMGGVVYYYGKPDSKIYNLVFDRYLKNIDKSKMLMIGDTMNTDILGAYRAGIDSVLLLTGNGEKIAEKIKAGVSDIFEGYQFKPAWISSGMK